LEPRRLGHIGWRLRPLLISEEGAKTGGGVDVMDEAYLQITVFEELANPSITPTDRDS
jgi:hypothetical protein